MAILQLTDIEPYVAWFIIALAGLEIFSWRFRKSWWLARQLISKAANTELTLTLSEKSVRTSSIHVDSEILWADVDKIEATAQGWLLYHGNAKSYLSARCLSAEAKIFIHCKTSKKSP